MYKDLELRVTTVIKSDGPLSKHSIIYPKPYYIVEYTPILSVTTV